MNETKSTRARSGSSYPPNGSIRTACPVCHNSDIDYRKVETMDSGLTKRIQELTVELSVRGTRPGHVGSGTQRRAGAINRELIAMFNAEQDYSDQTKQRIPTARGVILEAMIQHIVSAAFGKPSFSASEHEAAILKAATVLPESCERLQKLESKPVQSEDEQGYTKQDLREFTGYADGAVNKRLKKLGIVTASGGRPRKGIKPFSRDQVKKLLRDIIDDSGAQNFNKEKCLKSLETLC